MASPAISPRQVVLEEALQRRVIEAQRRFENHPTDEARVKLQGALQVLTDLVFRGKAPSGE